MAGLFQTLPTTLFNPLAARGAPVYAEVLLTLFAETQQHTQPLSRDLAVSLIAELIATAEALELTDDAAGDVEDDDGDITLARAGAILRYLVRCGWLRPEMQGDFTQTYVLPDYAFRLLGVLQELAANEPPRLQGLICSIHDLLQAAVNDGTAHIRLPEAHYQTRALLNGLRELQHNIGAHIEQVLRQLQASAVLDQIFTTYRADIVDRAYHQLRTTDHVSRFRPGVLSALAAIGSMQQIEGMAQRLRATGQAASVDSAVNTLLDQVRDIREQFESLDRTLQTIDVRHSQFVDSAVRTVDLQLSASSTTSGQLHTILAHLLAPSSPLATTERQEPDESLVSLYELALVDHESLAGPTRAPAPFVAEPAVAAALSEADIAAARDRTLQQLSRAVSRERVRRFAERALAGRTTVRGADIPLAGPDELPLLIYLRAYGKDGALGYRVEDVVDAGWVERDGVGFRDFVLRKA